MGTDECAGARAYRVGGPAGPRLPGMARDGRPSRRAPAIRTSTRGEKRSRTCTAAAASPKRSGARPACMAEGAPSAKAHSMRAAAAVSVAHPSASRGGSVNRGEQARSWNEESCAISSVVYCVLVGLAWAPGPEITATPSAAPCAALQRLEGKGATKRSVRGMRPQGPLEGEMRGWTVCRLCVCGAGTMLPLGPGLRWPRMHGT